MYKSQLNTKRYTKDFNSIPWDEAARVYNEAARQAEYSTLEDMRFVYDQAYDRRRKDALRLSGIDETEASYEGDLNLPYVPPTLDPRERKAVRDKAGNAALAQYFIKPYYIKNWGLQLLDQIIPLLGKHKLNQAGEGGTVSGLQYLEDNFDPKQDSSMGLYRFLMMDSRSEYLSGLGSGEAKRYCTLVPLILYAHKLYSNVPYSRWERSTLHYVVNSALANAMLTTVDYAPLNSEILLGIRNMALEIMSGAKVGEHRNPQTTYGLYRTKGTPIGDYPQLVQIMLCQTWAAHPNNRTKYMVLDPNDWDRMPDPLVDVDIFKEKSTTKQAKTMLPHSSQVTTDADGMPW